MTDRIGWRPDNVDQSRKLVKEASLQVHLCSEELCQIPKEVWDRRNDYELWIDAYQGTWCTYTRMKRVVESETQETTRDRGGDQGRVELCGGDGKGAPKELRHHTVASILS